MDGAQEVSLSKLIFLSAAELLDLTSTAQVSLQQI